MFQFVVVWYAVPLPGRQYKSQQTGTLGPVQVILRLGIVIQGCIQIPYLTPVQSAKNSCERYNFCFRYEFLRAHLGTVWQYKQQRPYDF